MNKTELIIPGSAGRPIALDITYLPGATLQPVVILVHGFKGFKNWGHYDVISQKIAEQGFTCLKFNFSYNGTTPANLANFDDLEAFGQNNYSTELRDLKKILDFTQDYIGLYGGDPSQINLIGHSRGGGITILTAAQDKRIKKLCTWASVKEFGKFVPENEIPEWKNSGVFFTYNSRTQQNMPVYYQLYEDFLQNNTSLDIPAHAKKMEIPWLIIHGTGDQTVPHTAAQKLHSLQPGSQLLLLENADHNFGGKHPWHDKELPPDAQTALDRTLGFFR